MSLQATSLTIDLRRVPRSVRHPLIFSTFEGLRADEALELLSDHDPGPLRHQFQTQVPGAFAWDDLASGPEVWRVVITKLSGREGGGPCCGHCGGA